MELKEFVASFAEEFDETPSSAFEAKTEFKELEEWSSLTALSIIAMIDEQFDKTVTGADLRKCKTIEELYNLVISK